MAENANVGIIGSFASMRDGGLKQAAFERVHPYVREALSENKRTGLLLAVRARWVALTVTAVILPFLNFSWELVYYELSLVGFALIGWAQLKVGQVTQSWRELVLIFADLSLLCFVMVVSSPLRWEAWPTAFQYVLSEFSYFYVLLAAATLGYSWRTLFAIGTWTAALWLIALAAVVFFGRELPELTTAARTAFAGYDRIMITLDPNDSSIPARIQEVVVFLIVASILAVNGRRNSDLVFQQANVVRERANLARHFPPNIVDRMADRDQPLGQVRSQNVAVMFVDIVGFTHMAEQKSPEDVIGLLRQFHGRLEAAVFDHQGTLDKFLGDGLMATFGTPGAGPDDAGNALRCGRAMLADIGRWNQERAAAGADPVRISIEVHYGLVVLGDIGSERRLEYAVLGDAVNVASRLEALTRTLGVAMIVSDDLVAALGVHRDAADLQAQGQQSLRGRDEPISVWTV